MYKFLKNDGGSFAPIFALLLALAVPVIGAGYDYTRVHSFKAKLQSATDGAVYSALVDARNSRQVKKIADRFISANLPDVEFESRRSLIEGNTHFQVRSKVKTPLIGLVGENEQWVYASTQLPDDFNSGKGSVGKKTITAKQLRKVERHIKKLLEKVPQKHRSYYEKQYGMYLDKLRKQMKSK